jgi:hypothetical protein
MRTRCCFTKTEWEQARRRTRVPSLDGCLYALR